MKSKKLLAKGPKINSLRGRGVSLHVSGKLPANLCGNDLERTAEKAFTQWIVKTPIMVN